MNQGAERRAYLKGVNCEKKVGSEIHANVVYESSIAIEKVAVNDLKALVLPY